MPHDHHAPREHRPHGHNGHAHLDPASGDRRVAVAIWANALLTVAQVIGGLLSGSLALIADALHNFSDMAALLIAFGARKIARRPADAAMTFGYRRIETVAALINYTTLILVGLYLIYEGVLRLADPPGVQGWTVVLIAGVALAIDTLTAALTYAMQKDSQNIRALFLHNLSDALSSVAVMIGGVLILLYDMHWVDPVITIGIAVYILWLALREFAGPVRTLMLGIPPGMDPQAVVSALRSVDAVADVHHVHLWQMDENAPALDAHIVLEPGHWDRVDAIKAGLKTRMEAEFGIAHSTLEFENAGACEAGAPVFGHDRAGG